MPSVRDGATRSCRLKGNTCLEPAYRRTAHSVCERQCKTALRAGHCRTQTQGLRSQRVDISADRWHLRVPYLFNRHGLKRCGAVARLGRVLRQCTSVRRQDLLRRAAPRGGPPGLSRGGGRGPRWRAPVSPPAALPARRHSCGGSAGGRWGGRHRRGWAGPCARCGR